MAKVLLTIRQTIKFFCILLIILSFFVVNSLVWVFIRDRWRRTYLWSAWLTVLARTLLWLLNGRCNTIGMENYTNEKGALLAGNHMSYMDVIMIGSKVTTCFVTSVEVKETPGLGQICQMAGCLFVERRNRSSLQKEIGELQEGLERHMTVTIFPEATSTNAEAILRFRRPLFLSAVMAHRPVVPMCLNYREVDGEPMSLRTRDNICWYGDMPFLPHLWKICGFKNLVADLHFLPAIYPSDNEEPGDIALKSQAAVESVFRPVR